MPLLVGCYSYTPIDFTAAPAGSEVRARITGAAMDRVALNVQLEEGRKAYSSTRGFRSQPRTW